jgi:membrane-associated phospholipid phosphatase
VRYLHVSPERLTRLLYPQTLVYLLATAAVLVAISILVRLKATLPLDLFVTRNLQLLDRPYLTKISKWLTFLGNSRTLVLLASGAAIICLLAGQSRAALFSAASLLALPANMVIKRIFDRERPGEPDVRIFPGPRWGFSYPSGHSMASAAFYGFLAFLLSLHIPEPTWRWILVSLFSLVPPLVGTSRIYLGAHWFSDVIAGIACGSLFVAVLAILYPV